MNHFTPDIIFAAQKAQHDYGVPASVTLAQFAEESAYGTRMPAGSNNPFGIKAVGDQPYVTAKTREVDKHGKSYFTLGRFRKFDSFAEAFEAHAVLLATSHYYKEAMEDWLAGDLEHGIRALAVHYATAPDYASVLLSVIHSQHLQQYDVVHLNP